MKKLIKKYYLNSVRNIIELVILIIIIPLLSNLIPFLSKTILDEGISNKNTFILSVSSMSIIIVTVVKSVLDYNLTKLTTKINLNAVNELKKELISKIINSSMTYINSNSSEYLLNRINEVNYLSNILSPELCNFIISIISGLVAIIILMKRNFIIGCICFLFIPLGYILSKKSFDKMDNYIFNNMESSASSNDLIIDNIRGISLLKQYNKEENAIRKINTQLNSLQNSIYMQSIRINKYINLLSGFFFSFRLALLWIVGYYIVSGYLSIGDYTASSQYISLVITPILSAGSIISNLKPAIIALKRIDMSICTEDNKNIVRHNCNKIYELKVSNLKFGYKCDKLVLKGICFELIKDDVLHIRGANGSGKSTIVNILLGYYSDYEGSILVNGRSLTDYNIASIRNRIAVLPQEPYLFQGTIKDNIYMASLEDESEYLENRMKELLDSGLLNGVQLDKKIHESGKELSGGQMQRISVARMYMRDADIYIFDEPNNNLDRESKEIIKKFISEELKNKLVILVSHDNEFKDISNKCLQI